MKYMSTVKVKFILCTVNIRRELTQNINKCREVHTGSVSIDLELEQLHMLFDMFDTYV